MGPASPLARLSEALPLDDLTSGARLVAGLPGFLRQTLTLEAARRDLADCLERREAAWLEAVTNGDRPLIGPVQASKHTRHAAERHYLGDGPNR